MKIINTSPHSTPFLRRMLRWVCKELELKKPLREARFRTRRTQSYSGHAWATGRIVISVSATPRLPIKWCGYKRACMKADGTYPELADAMELIVMLTAHEMGHIVHFRKGNYGRGHEDYADAHARTVLKAFRDNRDALLAAWNKPDAQPKKPKLGIVEKRTEKAYADLARWEKKMRLAKTKVAKCRAKVKYYERRQAATQAIGGNDGNSDAE